METNPGAARLEPAAPAAHAALAGADLVLALEDALDLDVLERRLLTFAVHEQGLAAEGAWLALWSAAREGFEVTAALRAAPAGLSLRDALRSPGLPPPRGPEDGIAFDASQLEPSLEAAWTRGIAAAEAVPAGRTRPWRGIVGAFPLRAGLRPYGLLVLSWPESSDLERRSRDLASFQRLATVAAESLERHADARRRQRQSEAIRELARLAVSSVNLAEALRLAVRLATHGSQARGAALWLGSSPTALRLEATHGPAGRREAIGRMLEPLARGIADLGRPAAFAAGDSALPVGQSGETLESVALEPLNAFGAVRGVIAVYDRAVPHRAGHGGFDAADREFLAALADLVAGLAAHAERFDRQRGADRRLDEMETELRRAERLAAAGVRATEWTREARHPLASIAAFARRMHRGLAEDHPHREYLEIVVREAERLERRLTEPAVPPPPPPALRVENVNAAVQEVLQELSERLVRRRVRLLKRLAPDLPALLIHPEGLRRTLRNILDQALDRVAVGGRIRVESRRAAGHVVMEVANDGARTPGEMLEELFAPFTENRNITPEPGLALARRIVREHGGEVRLRSEGEWTSVVSLTIPVAENRDRRNAAGERRAPRTDRRESGAPS